MSVEEKQGNLTSKFKIEKSLLNAALEGGLPYENLNIVALRKLWEYCKLVIHGDYNWGDNVINDILDGSEDARPKELNLDIIDYKFEMLKVLKIHPDRQQGSYTILGAGDQKMEFGFLLNPNQLPDRTILYSEYPSSTVRKEIEIVLRFYKYLQKS